MIPASVNVKMLKGNNGGGWMASDDDSPSRRDRFKGRKERTMNEYRQREFVKGKGYYSYTPSKKVVHHSQKLRKAWKKSVCSTQDFIHRKEEEEEVEKKLR